MSGSRAARAPDFSSVTEQPSQGATRLQMSMLRTRYGWAADHAAGKDVLEAACGAGLGLGWLAERARRVEAGDIDEDNCRIARATYHGQANLGIGRIDALDLPFEARSFDVVLLFEALYYLPDVAQFLTEAKRVLRADGRLLISTVNCEWSGFHPSPFHTRYWAAGELVEKLQQAGFEARAFAAFPERDARGLRNLLKTMAARGGCLPRTMRGRAVLKRIFYGPLERIPPRLGATELRERMIPANRAADLTRYRNLYFECRSAA